MLHLFNIFRENDGKENCAQLLEEECIKMFGTKYLNDEHVMVTIPTIIRDRVKEHDLSRCKWVTRWF